MIDAAPSVQAAKPPSHKADAGETFAGTAGIVEKPATFVGGIARLASVRAAKHEAYDRVVFEFSGRELPGYKLEYIDKPVRACGSGKVVPITGDGWLEVLLQPAEAHDDAGKPTVTERELKPGLRIVQELELTCDFEAQVVWVLGTSSPNRYRVLELKDPPRLVVDIKH